MLSVRPRQITASRAWSLISNYPDNFHLQRRYQDNRRAGFFADVESLIVYYARLLIGRQTKEAITLAEKLTQQSPEFPWTQLQLAEIYLGRRWTTIVYK